MIGIAIDSSALKLAQIKNGRILATASVPLPPGLVVNGGITDPAAMATILRNTLRASNLRGRQCALVLPPETVLSQHLTLPMQDMDALKKHLPASFQAYVSTDPGAYDYDAILTETRDGHAMLYAAAVRKSITEEYWRICRQAGLTMKTAIPAEMAWQNLLRPDLPEKLAILDLTTANAHMYIFARSNFVMGKALDASGQPLAAQVSQAVNVYNFTLPAGEPTLADLYCCAPPDAVIPEISGIRLHPGSCLLGADADQTSQFCAIAASGALQPGKSANQAMNFARHQSGFDLRRVLPAVLAAVIGLLLFAKFGFLDPLHQKALAYDALSQKREQLAQINARLAGFDELQQQYLRYGTSLMRDTEATLVSRGDVLALVEAKLGGKAVIETLTVNNNILTIHISGITLEEASSIVRSLEASELVSSAAIHSAAAEDGNLARILISVTLGNEEVA